MLDVAATTLLTLSANPPVVKQIGSASSSIVSDWSSWRLLLRRSGFASASACGGIAETLLNHRWAAFMSSPLDTTWFTKPSSSARGR
jgi:hypothetical protein